MTCCASTSSAPTRNRSGSSSPASTASSAARASRYSNRLPGTRIASLASSQGRRLGDYLGGTLVVHERVPVRASPMAVMPPQLAGWAAGLDLSRIPDDLALAARQFLARAHELAPAVRDGGGYSPAAPTGGVAATV